MFNINSILGHFYSHVFDIIDKMHTTSLKQAWSVMFYPQNQEINDDFLRRLGHQSYWSIKNWKLPSYENIKSDPEKRLNGYVGCKKSFSPTNDPKVWS